MGFLFVSSSDYDSVLVKTASISVVAPYADLPGIILECFSSSDDDSELNETAGFFIGKIC